MSHTSITRDVGVGTAFRTLDHCDCLLFFLSSIPLSPVKKSRTLKLLTSSTQLEDQAYYNSKTRHETESETKIETEIEFAQSDNQL